MENVVALCEEFKVSADYFLGITDSPISYAQIEEWKENEKRFTETLHREIDNLIDFLESFKKNLPNNPSD